LIPQCASKFPHQKARGRPAMLKYISKFTIDILPSVLATIIGAYIVNHYIVAKPANAPAAAVSTADPKKADAKASGVANIPAAGVKAKGISEKAIQEKTAAEKPAVADKADETASLAGAEPHRPQPAPREKTIAKVTAAPVQVPAPAAANPVPVEAGSVPEEKRDANDLARAAIERLRGTNEASPRVQEAVRTPEAPRVPETPRLVTATPVQPLPPPIMVSTPSNEVFNPATGSVPVKPPYASARIDDARRPTPPADIPLSSRPIELRAEAMEPAPREHTSVAEDVLSAAKSVFHAVLPR
jgi:hypothetical protein